MVWYKTILLVLAGSFSAMLHAEEPLPTHLAQLQQGLIDGAPEILSDLYHHQGTHRNMADGQFFEGRKSVLFYFDELLQHGTPSKVEISSVSEIDARTQLVRVALEHTSAAWPRYWLFFVAQSADENGWVIVASRAGANYAG